LAGIAGNQFTFLGFAPQKKGRETFFKNLPSLPQPVVFFESTHRILKTLEALSLSAPFAKVYLARELTKLFEEVLVGTPAEVLEILNTEPVKQKGEFVIVLEYQLSITNKNASVE
jgi:16S rRNA (cytidine1402-2'-O)-methyltransferase